MNLKYLSIKNFKSFLHPVEINFQELPVGLYNVTGHNYQNPTLGSNGAGKTSLFQAWYFALFGKTPDGLKASQVEAWGSDGTTEVIIRWEQGGKDYQLRRARHPNRLELRYDDETYNVDQGRIEEVTKLTPAIFELIYFRHQFARDFFDLPPSEKMNLLQQILNLQNWLDHSKKAGDFISQLEKDIYAKELEVARCEGNEDRLLKQILELKKQKQISHDEIQTELQEIDVCCQASKKEIRRLERELDKHKKDHEQILQQEKQDLAHCEKLAMSLEKAKKDLMKHETTVMMKEKKIQVQKKKVQSMKTIGNTCPTCTQTITNTQKQDCVDYLQKLSDKYQRELQPLVEEQKKQEQHIKKLEQHKHAGYDQFGETQRKTRQILGTMGQKTQKLRDVKYELKQYQTEMSRIETMVRDYKQEIQKQEQDLQVIRETKTVVEQDIRMQQKKKQALEVWKEDFKHIRLFLMDEAISELEIETNRVLDEIGLQGWRVQFDIERETKAGKVIKGFAVSIFSPGKDEPVPWEAWSGGEGQRLRLAGRIGLANMAVTVLGLQFGVEVWDEPTSFVGEEGISDIKSLLRARAEQHHLKIFLVDHRSYDFSGFIGKWTVTKSERGSVLELT